MALSLSGGGGGPDANGFIEWSDVIVVRDETGNIVDWFTQFGGSQSFATLGTDVSIGVKAKLTSPAYRHFSDIKVGARDLTIDNGGTFDQSLGGFTMSGRLLNNGSTTLNATTVVTGSIENNLSLTVRSILMLQGVSTTTGTGFTLASQTGAPGDLYLRGGMITGYTADTTNGNVTITDFSINGRISGHGIIGSEFGYASYPSNGGYLVLHNTGLGTIDANVSGQTLTIKTGTSPINPIRNDGVMEASNGGTLRVAGSYQIGSHFESFVEQGSTGVIRANDGATVYLDNAQLTGGKIDCVGTGIVRMENFFSRVSDIEITARATLDIGRSTTFAGSIVNRGKITNSEFDPALVVAAEGVTLTGGGTVRLVDGYYEASIVGAQGAVLTNVDNTIIGVGGIGPDYMVSGGNLTLINKGTVAADRDTVYRTDDVDVLSIDGLARVVNTGTLEARNGATLDIKSLGAPLENAGGTIQAVGTGSKVAIFRTQVDGGTLKGVSGGTVDVREATLNGLTLEGTTLFGVTTLKGTIVNKGTMANANAGALFVTPTDATLSGGGTVKLFGGYYNSGITSTGPGSVLTNLDNTIIGVGGISGRELSVINRGRIIADQDAYKTDDTDVLSIDSVGAFTNSGILQAQRGAKLDILSLTTPLKNAGGTIQATGAGSKVVIFRTEVEGGTLKGVSGGTLDAREATLNGVTLEGTTIFGVTTLKGAIVHKGTMTNGNAGALMISTADATLSGGGGVRLLGGYYNSGVTGTGASSVLRNVDNTIIGVGGIGGNGLSIVNQGRIVADKDAYKTDDVDTLVINDVAALTNQGYLQAQNGAKLVLGRVASGAIQNAGGTIRAIGTESTVEISTAIKGGTVGTSSGGSVKLINGAVLDGGSNPITLIGAIKATGQTVTLKGNIVQRGDVDLAYSDLSVGATTALTGGGTIGLVASSIGASSAGLKLTNVDNTIHGFGSIGRGSGLALSNGANGRIVADTQGETLTVQTGRVVANTGVLSAKGGILDIRDKVTGTGYLEVTGGGTLVVDQGVDHRVVFTGATADTLSLSGRTPNQGGTGFDFDIAGMGVGDRIKLDVRASVGQLVDFTFAGTTASAATLGSTAFADANGLAHVIKLKGSYSEGQFDLVGGADGMLGFVRVATRDGTEQADALKAAAVGERLIGLGGDDLLQSGAGRDVLDGSRGIDTASYVAATSGVGVNLETKAAQSVGGGMGIDRLISIENLTGSNYDDKLFGDSLANTLVGNGGSDTLKGNGGSDILVGGKGADDLLGGVDGDTDTFVFLVGDSGNTATSWDQIYNFRSDTNATSGQRSAGADLIDLRGIDGDLGVAGDQKLRFVDTFTTAVGSQPDGQVSVTKGSTKNSMVLIDWNGDNKVDMTIEVLGVTALTADNFLL